MPHTYQGPGTNAKVVSLKVPGVLIEVCSPEDRQKEEDLLPLADLLHVRRELVL